MITGRIAIEAILRGDGDRIIVVVGTCSFHDSQLAALEYARKLKAYRNDAKENLEILMRVYFEEWVEVSPWIHESIEPTGYLGQERQLGGRVSSMVSILFVKPCTILP